MATGDFQDLYNKTIYAAQRDTSVAYDVSRAKEAVNEAYLTLCDLGPQWSFLQHQGSFTLTTNQDAYTYTSIATGLSLTGGINDVIGVNFTTADQPQAHYCSWEDYFAIKQLNPSLAAGTPHLWSTYGDTSLQVWPKPSSNLATTLLVLKTPTELVSNGDVPLVPLAWRFKLLVPAAAAILLRQEGGDAASEGDRYEAIFQKHLEAASQTLVLKPPASQPTQAPLLLPSGLRGSRGTFLDLAHKVCYETNTRPWNQYDLYQAKGALNQVYRSLLDADQDWDFLEFEGQITLTAGQDTYSITSIATALNLSAVRQILALVHDSASAGGSGALEPMGWKELESLARSTQDGEQQGKPAAYAVWDGKVRFWPPPNDNYALGVYLIKGTADLSGDSDTPLVPEEWRYEVLVPLAAARVLQQSPDPNQAGKSALLEARGTSALTRFKEARGAAKFPALRLESPGFSRDLPGSFVDDWSL